jgi:hypothetical protein
MQQLELFAQPTPTPQYKAGDWVKTKRKPAIAAHIKRGEIFQVSAIHPINGSIKFHNPHINEWDYLYPDEVKSCPTPVTVETVVEQISEVIVETVVEQISEVIVETVVEQISEVIVETVVEQISEVIVETVVEQKNYWNSDGYSSNGFLESHYKIRIEGKQKSINCPEVGCTGPYNSYRWREGRVQRAKYVPSSKCPAVRKALAIGQPISEILKIISNQ